MPRDFSQARACLSPDVQRVCDDVIIVHFHHLTSCIFQTPVVVEVSKQLKMGLRAFSDQTQLRVLVNPRAEHETARDCVVFCHVIGEFAERLHVRRVQIGHVAVTSDLCPHVINVVRISGTVEKNMGASLEIICVYCEITI